jgi:ABA4-like protein
MTPEKIFSVAGMVAFVGWVALALFPNRRWVAVLSGLVLPATLAALYVVLVLLSWGGSEGGFSSLADVARLFENRWLLLAGWVHYLAFDLFVGSWVARDAGQRGVRHVLVVPCLALTFLFGPAGWLSYLGLRAIAARSPSASPA